MTAHTAQDLFRAGYYPLSNKYRTVARIDRTDWVTWMADQYRRAPADFYVHENGQGPTSNTGQWGRHYCAVFSKDKIEGVDPIVYGELKRLWTQSGASVKYVPPTRYPSLWKCQNCMTSFESTAEDCSTPSCPNCKAGNQYTSPAPERPLAWTTDLPTEPGWYWIRHPDDGDQATMRHLARSHGEWSFDGRLSSEILSQGYSCKPKRLDTLWMKMVGCKFYGPLRVPK